MLSALLQFTRVPLLSCHYLGSPKFTISTEPQAPLSNSHFPASLNNRLREATAPSEKSSCSPTVVQTRAQRSQRDGVLSGSGARAAATCCPAGAFQFVLCQWRWCDFHCKRLEDWILTVLHCRPFLRCLKVLTDLGEALTCRGSSWPFWKYPPPPPKSSAGVHSGSDIWLSEQKTSRFLQALQPSETGRSDNIRTSHARLHPSTVKLSHRASRLPRPPVEIRGSPKCHAGS